MLTKFFKYSLPIGIAGIVLNIFLFATNLYYELVVPVIENSSLEGAAFTFFDYLIFYTPCIFMVLFIVYIVLGQIYMKRKHAKNEDKVTEDLIIKNAEVQKVLNEKADFLNEAAGVALRHNPDVMTHEERKAFLQDDELWNQENNESV